MQFLSRRCGRRPESSTPGPGPSREVVSVGPLLTTKLHAPRRRRGLVARPRLIERLSRGDEAALTLVSAPAGFGKTTVLTDWLSAAAPHRLAAWLSLDARDNDPALYWAYLVAAVQTAVPEVGTGALALLSSPHTTADAVVASLVNDLDAVPGDLVLVLDDYHVIESAEVHDEMAFLLFALALLASGFASASVGTYAGQVIM